MADLQPTCREDFEIAIICALPSEYNAVSLVFDEFWDEDGDHYGKAAGDPNSYTTGRIGKYNTVLALLPHTGKVNAASSSASIRSSYSGLRLALLVGICGGIPRYSKDNEEEILLGDVIISKSVIQYDFGRRYSDRFLRKNTTEDNLSKPNKDIRSLLVVFETDLGLERLQQSTSQYLKQLQANSARRKRGGKYLYPGTAADKLFDSSYFHKHQVSPKYVCQDCNEKSDPVCDKALKSTCIELGCEEKYLVARKRLEAKQNLEKDNNGEAQEPAIWVGSIASGDTVMNSANDRDRIATEEDVIAFDMEGAGVWEEVPYIIIKGVYNYADSHQNEKWQNFAAATAASASKAILERYIQTDKAPSDRQQALEKESITQGGSKYTADVKGKDVTQGNNLQVSTPQVSRDYRQEGSEFGGNIEGESLVNQGNKFSI